MASNAGDTIANNVTTTSTIAISGKPSARGRENGFVNSGSDQDWFRITLDAGELYEFSLSDRGNTPLDSTLSLRDASGLQIAFDDDSGAGDNARLLFRAPTAGTYYLDVGGFDSSTGGYQLTAREVPATVNTFSSVLVNGSTTGVIGSTNDQDFHSILLAAGESYIFDVTGAIDSTLSLRDGAGTELVFNDDGGVVTDARIEFTAAAAGTFYLDVGGFDNSTGAYTLAARIDDAADDTDTTDALVIGGSRTGVVNTAADQDFYSVTLVAGQNYIFDVTGAIDSTLSLRDSFGTELVFNDDGGFEFNSRIEFTAAGTGTFYLDVGGFGPATGAYTLAARVDDVADDTLTTDVLSIGGSRTGTISTGADQDFFRVSLTAGQGYVFRATGNGDETLTLRNSSGTQLAFDDDSGPGDDSLLAFQATATGTYYVDVGNFGENVGGYTVSAVFAV